ncbi:MAG TPA: hypothetical protein VNI02_22765 [Blastocatellia bacterium]|nr:hypothetical protein [Blastocatellia bacterium]
MKKKALPRIRSCAELSSSYLKRVIEIFYVMKAKEAAKGGVLFDYRTGEGEGPPLDADAKPPDTPRGIEFIFGFVESVGRDFLPAYLIKKRTA